MKMTKELKEVLLKGVDEMLDQIRICESWAKDFEASGDEAKKDFWREDGRKCQKKVLKLIEDLIEVEGE